MKTTNEKENTTRNAYLPMSLLNDGDLDTINNSNLDGDDRDIAVYYFIASRMVEMTQIVVNVYKRAGYKDALHHKTDLANFLAKNNKSNVAQNLLENFEFVGRETGHKLINRSK